MLYFLNIIMIFPSTFQYMTQMLPLGHLWEITWRCGKRRHPNLKVINGLQTSIGPLKVHEAGFLKQKSLSFLNFQMPKSADTLCSNLMPTPILTGITSLKERIASKSIHHGFKPDSYFSFEAARKVSEMRERTAVKAARFVLGREGKSNFSFLFNNCSKLYRNMLVSTDTPSSVKIA
jgi:hypothetical protein